MDAVEQSVIQAARGLKQFGESRSAAGDVEGAVAAYEDALKKIEGFHSPEGASLRSEIETAKNPLVARKAQLQKSAAEQSVIQAARELKQFGESRSAAGDFEGAIAAYRDALKKIEGIHSPESDSLRSEIKEGKISAALRKEEFQQREHQLDQMKIADNVKRLKEEGDRDLKDSALADAITCYKTALQEIEKLDGRSHELKSAIEAALAEAERGNTAAGPKKTETTTQTEATGCVLDAQKIVEKFGKAVVLIKSERLEGDKKLMALGTGFIVDPGGLIVTCHHVVGGATSVIVKSKAGDFPARGVLGYDIKNDIAILKIDAANLPVVRLGTTEGLKPGTKVVVIGNPLGYENTLSEGVFSAIRENKGRKVVQITAQIAHGNSGGPVFTDTGDVVGVVSFVVVRAQDLNFAIPIDVANDLLKSSPQLVEFSALPNTDPNLLLQKARAAYIGKEYDVAIEWLKKFLDIYEEDASTWCFLGECYMRKNSYGEARRCYQSAHQLHPDLESSLGLGRALYSLKMYDEALSLFSQAAGSDPHCAEAHAGMAAIMMEKKNFDGALQTAKRAVAMDPKSYYAQMILGNAYLVRGNTEKAITELRKAIKIDPDQPSAHYNLALAYQRARYPDLAQSECDKLKKIDKYLANQLMQVLKHR